MRLHLADIEIELIPAPGVWMPATRDLVLADVHLGKSAAFRARGIPVPEGETAADLDRMARLVREFGARRLIIAGDLVHAPASLGGGFTPLLESWVRELGCGFLLVEGNHDRAAGRLPVETAAHLDLGPLRIVHDPADLDAGQAGIAGHLHPSVRIASSPRSSFRQPCFRLRGHHLVLPAFGTFTGTHAIPPQLGDRHFAALRGRLVEIPESLTTRDFPA